MSVDINPFTFLQVSDVHLDSKIACKRLSMPHGKRQMRTREILEALVKALAVARERRVDAIVIPGDLWDSESVTNATINRLLEAFMEMGDTPIIIAPGNHDYLSRDSFYDPLRLEAGGMPPWPANVHVFASSEFTTFRHPARPEISFTGRAFTANVPETQRLLAGSVPKAADAAVNMLLLHGSLDGYTGSDARWPGKITAPFSAAELKNLGFDYAALGHYHDFTEVCDPDGRLLGAYSGCLVGRWFEESGPRYALAGTIDFGDGGVPQVTLEKVETDCRRLIVVAGDTTGLTSKQVLSQLRSALAAQDAREQVDIVCLKITGRHPPGGEPTYVVEQLSGLYYHLVVEDESRPDYLLQNRDQRTTEGKFVEALLALKEKAEAAGALTTDSEYEGQLSARTIEDALYYGLEALKQQRVTVRDVD